MAVGSPIQTLGRYCVHDEIVSGGGGVVHFGSVATDRGIRVVAIKRLHPSLLSEQEFRDSFVREAGLAVRIAHHNVVPTLEVGEHDDEVFVVMEYLHGESLARLMSGGVAPAPSVASRVTIDVLHGLAAVHDARDDAGRPLGVVHRDLSPHNVMVGADGTTCVIDFGIAKVAAWAGSTRPGMVKGKLSYLSPEQIKAEEVTPATDQFAAAVVLWEMLTGRRLFAASSVGNLMRRLVEGRIEPPSTYAPHVSPQLDAVVLRGLRPSPAERYESTNAFADALGEACKPASRDLVAKWVRQRAGAVLDERARIVAEISKGTLQPEGSVDAPRESKRGPRRWVVLAVGMVLVVIGATTVAAYVGSRPKPHGVRGTVSAIATDSTPAIPH